MRHGLIPLKQPSESDFEEIRQLVQLCASNDGVEIKLNWSMMQYRDPEHVSDYFVYAKDKVVGYMPLDGFGKNFEITAIVHPAHRRQGIFRQLLTAAIAGAHLQQANQLLLVNYRASVAGNATVKAFGFTYKFSEYNLTTENSAENSASHSIPPYSVPLTLERVSEQSVAALSAMLARNFGDGGWLAVDALRAEFERPHARYYLASLAGERVGHIGVLSEGDTAYVRAVGILPEYRSRGFGRQLLNQTLQLMRQEGIQQFELDVETANEHALRLYKDCGFCERNVYDYYLVAL